MMMMRVMKMKMVKSLVLLSLLSLAVSDSPSDDTHTHTLNLELQHPQLLTRLSTAGEQCVVGEIKRALLGVKQLREMLDTQQHTHLQLMDTLTHSYNKKRGAEQLAQGVEQKLREAELSCHGALRSQWAECRPCLEESCRVFYTSTCHRGANTFTLQVEELFRRVASHLDAQEQQLFNQNPDEPHPTARPTPEPTVPDPPSVTATTPAEGLTHLIASLDQASEEAEALYARCLATVAGMRSVLGPAFHTAFSEELRPKPLPPTGLGGVTHTLLQLGRSALQEVESVVQEVSSALQEVEFAVQEVGSTLSGLLQGLTGTKDKKEKGGALCRQLRRQPANCWRLQDQCSSCTDTFLTECPSVSQQYSELQDIHLLVNASRVQYSEVQQVALRHVENTLLWANHMTAKHAWVTHITNGTTAPKHTFSITKLTLVTPGGSDQLEGSASEAWHVEACLFDSPPISMSVPAQLEPTDPAFINYVTQEAFEVFKHSIPTATSSRSDQG